MFSWRMPSEQAPNRLIHEKSPYLLQHAHNPVDWYPWGQEAFQKARTEKKPIFLSIGYSTCHWCHVMERESFENQAVAEIMNRSYVSIKVDREERPDVDRVYMTFVQSTTGSGGWPMSVFLTPELKPFLGGTYYPPDDRYGRPGFGTLLTRIAEIWEKSPEKIMDQGAQFTEAIEAHLREAQSFGIEPLDAELAGERLPPIGIRFRFRGGRIQFRAKISAPGCLQFPAPLLAARPKDEPIRYGRVHPAEDGAGRNLRPSRRRLPSLFRR